MEHCVIRSSTRLLQYAAFLYSISSYRCRGTVWAVPPDVRGKIFDTKKNRYVVTEVSLNMCACFPCRLPYHSAAKRSALHGALSAKRRCRLTKPFRCATSKFPGIQARQEKRSHTCRTQPGFTRRYPRRAAHRPGLSGRFVFPRYRRAQRRAERLSGLSHQPAQ